MVKRLEAYADILTVHRSIQSTSVALFRGPAAETARRTPHFLASSLFDDRRHDTGADRAAALTNGEAQLLLHGDRHNNVTSIDTLSPGITISVPSGNLITPVTSVVRK